MMKMMNLVALCAVAFWGLIGQSPTGSHIDPAKALEEIAKIRKASSKEVSPGFFEFDAEPARKRAKEIISGVDPDKVDPAKADLWAKIFIEANAYPSAIKACQRFISGTQDPVKHADAGLIALSAAVRGELIDEIWSTTRTLSPANADQASSFFGIVTAQAPTPILVRQGPDQCLKYLELAESRLDWNAVKLPSEDEVSIKASFLGSKAYYLSRLGKAAEAEAAVDKALALVGKGSNDEKFLSRRKQMIAMIGKPAKTLNPAKSYGTFQDLDKLKGKVVILDFYAHWCGPCIATFPEMKRIYQGYRSKGLEIVGVTKDWGYFGQEQGITPEVEREKFNGFLAKHQLPWSTALVEKERFAEFGVSYLPSIVVIDKKGIVRFMDEQVYTAGIRDKQYVEKIVQKLIAE